MGRHIGNQIELAGHQSRHAGGCLRHRFKNEFLDFRFTGPIVCIAFQYKAIVFDPFHEPERAGSHRIFCQVSVIMGFAVLLIHHRCKIKDIGQRDIRLFADEDHGMVIDNFYFGDRLIVARPRGFVRFQPLFNLSRM